MAWFARGPILEVGLDHGKSASIMARAVVSSRNGASITSIELKAQMVRKAKANLESLGLADQVLLVQGRSEEVIPTLPDAYDVVFLDGDHSYSGVRADLSVLQGRIVVGGAILVHDYWDHRNDDPANEDYGVRAAVDDLAAHLGLCFLGGFGALALFQQT